MIYHRASSEAASDHRTLQLSTRCCRRPNYSATHVTVSNGLITSAIKLEIKLTIKLKLKSYCSNNKQHIEAAFCCSYNKMLLVVAAITKF